MSESQSPAIPPNFSWIEEGVLATSSTIDNHDQYNWLMTNGFKKVISIENTRPKQILQHEKTLTNDWYLCSPYNICSISEIKKILESIDEMVHLYPKGNNLGGAVLVHCHDAKSSSAVVAACWLLRKYRYEVADAVKDAQELLVLGEDSMQSYICKKKVFEYHMQWLQNGFGCEGERGQGGYSNLWFPEKPYDHTFARKYTCGEVDPNYHGLPSHNGILNVEI